MDDFASCYFCGAAIEAPIREYPVVPDEIDPDVDTGAAVALCPTCRRKLDTVLEPVVEAMEELHGDVVAGSPAEGGGPSDADPVAGSGDAGEAGRATDDAAGRDPGPDADPSSEPADEADAGSLADLTVPGPANVTEESGEDRLFGEGDDPETDPGTTAAGAGEADAPTPEDDAGANAGDGTIGDAATFPGDSSGDPTANGTGEESPSEGNDPGGAVEAGSGGDPGGAVEAGSGGDPGGAVEAESGGDPGGTTDAESGDDPDPGPSPSSDRGDGEGESSGGDRQVSTEDIPVAAYNKIVKLLKNREFPVDRREIEDLASSAYDFPQDDCRRAVDAMIDRGVLTEDGGRLRKGDA